MHLYRGELLNLKAVEFGNCFTPHPPSQFDNKKELMNPSKKIKIKLLKLESIENGNLLKIMLDSNNALSLNFEQEKNLSDELAMGKELEEDDQDQLSF